MNFNRDRFIELARGWALGLLLPFEKEEFRQLQEQRERDQSFRSAREIANDRKIEGILKNLT